ncbi:hypothetical protein FKM82_028094, partial [Ascaphus truei]
LPRPHCEGPVSNGHHQHAERQHSCQQRQYDVRDLLGANPLRPGTTGRIPRHLRYQHPGDACRRRCRSPAIRGVCPGAWSGVGLRGGGCASPPAGPLSLTHLPP